MQRRFQTHPPITRRPVLKAVITPLLVIALLIVPWITQAAQVTLAWDANNSVPDGYRMFQRLESRSFDYSAPVWSGTATSCTISNLADNTTYYFVVRAFDGSAQSGNSNEVSFKYTTAPAFTITASAGANGTISPSGSVAVNQGANLTFTITPNALYHIQDVLVDGVSKGAVSSYTFPAVNANHSISAVFAINTYSISAFAGANGRISPAGVTTVASGGAQTYFIYPDSGYKIADVRVDGASVGAVSSYRFSSVNANHSISATFAPLVSSYTITATAGAGGTILPVGLINVAAGGSQTFGIVAQSGYQIEDLLVDNISRGPLTSYTFRDVSANHTIAARFRPLNQAPTADAGPDQTVDEGARVTLSGANSMDPDDGIAAFGWKQIAGPAVVLSAPKSEQTQFTAPNVDGDGISLEFELTVTDYNGVAVKDTCIVNVSTVNQSPEADAGADQTVNMGDRVVLDATASFDVDGDLAGFYWRQTNGPQVVLTDPESATPAFTAPDVGPQGATVVFELTVTDAGGLKATDTCMVSICAVNLEPSADAGDDQTAVAGEEIVLDGSASSDPDGSLSAFQWKQTLGPPVALTDPTAVNPSFIAPEVSLEGTVLAFELIVTDNNGLQGRDECLVEVRPAQDSELPDTQAPELTVTNPSRSKIFTSDATIDIRGTAADDHGVVSVTWQNNFNASGAAVLSAGTWKIDDLGLQAGWNTITITASDAAGNESSQTLRVYLNWKRRLR